MLLIVACLASTALAAGCGGDDASSGQTAADQWAEGFCTAISTWTDELQRIGDSAGDPSSLDVDSLKQAAEDVGTATDSFVDELRQLGAPDTESGQAVEDSLESLADTLESEQTDIEQAVDDVTGLTGVPTAIAALGTSLTAMGTALQETLDAVESADAGNELETALEDSIVCDEISS